MRQRNSLSTYRRARARDTPDNVRPDAPVTTPPPDAAERQTRIAEIKALLAASGLVPKDMFLTQPPAPSKEDEPAYAQWQDRERHRRPIAHRMSLYGLTAHDLAPTEGENR